MGRVKEFKLATVKYLKEAVGKHDKDFELQTLQGQLDSDVKAAKKDGLDTDPSVANKITYAQTLLDGRKAKDAGKAILELEQLLPEVKATREVAARKKGLGAELKAKRPVAPEFTPEQAPHLAAQGEATARDVVGKQPALAQQGERDAAALQQTAETKPQDRSMPEGDNFTKKLAKVKLDLKRGTIDFQGRNFAQKFTMDGETYGEPEYVASGTSGTVVKYTSAAGKSVVMKAVTVDEEFDTEYKNNRFLAEGGENAPGRENVLLMKGVVQEGSLAYIVMDCAAGDLNDSKHAMNALSETGALPEEARSVLNQYMMKQAVQGMKYVRDQNMIHFDLKELNAMIMADGTVKIADFGHSEVGVKGGAKTDVRGTNVYNAREYQDDKVKYGKATAAEDPTKSDTYALGRMLDSLHTGNLTPTIGPCGKAWGSNPDLTGALGNVNAAMTKENAEERPTLEAALDSSYLRNLDNYDPAIIKELMAATVAYSSALQGKKVNDRNFKDLSVDLHIQRTEVQDIEKKLKDADQSGKIPLKVEWETARTRLEKLEADMRTLANDKTVKPQLDKVREVSQRLKSGG